MLKSIFFAFCILSTLSINAQNSPESPHLIFKGVPIDGPLKVYTTKMQQNGFTLINSKEGISILKGDFASYKGCTIGVATLKQKDLVYKIAVLFPEQDTWSSLASNYFSLKEMLTEKYGEPNSRTEEFDGGEPTDDNTRMYYVQFDKCKYSCVFRTEKGTIELSIEHDGVTSCFVRLAYFDKINSSIIKAKAIDDL
ncbi:MAG: hypothetical protein ACK5RG_21715 [Cyclobacteriaceae bacterium]|jgi:hypothetical protein